MCLWRRVVFLWPVPRPPPHLLNWLTQPCIKQPGHGRDHGPGGLTGMRAAGGPDPIPGTCERSLLGPQNPESGTSPRVASDLHPDPTRTSPCPHHKYRAEFHTRVKTYPASVLGRATGASPAHRPGTKTTVTVWVITAGGLSISGDGEVKRVR